jgi:hypothetical protein
MIRPPIIEGKYRYRLDEQPLGNAILRLAVIQINPSLADGKRLDPAVGKIKKWAEGKYGLIVFLNLFAYINSRQTEIAENDYQILVGSQNDKIIKEEANQADKVIIAWEKPRGVFVKHYQRRIKKVFELLDGIQLHRVGKLSHDKYPRHGRMWNGDNRMEYEVDILEGSFLVEWVRTGCF